ncbi:hypothetical protein KQ313_06475 [Synechococcus sp. CS-1325]|uniref:hypothetical protein n=1 Tax=Synechococcus sp. CS-1325 TaxID=2847979 RepID=UPI000DB8F6AE|nr:hypothetical protein [Synechococcus sp. CS-1325]MCT0199320.1 hypothetical protein [Synechococcus sp. CS-1325]PZV00165.1 MAG: hypothetical protein DCF24_07950 [Cyanobium sp.]
MQFRYYAKEDPWQDDDDGNHGRPVTLARMGDGPDTEAIWAVVRGAWQPFPDLWGRLIGGDWWDRIHEERARRCFDAEAFAGGEILEPLPAAAMDLLCEAYQARNARKAKARAQP